MSYRQFTDAQGRRWEAWEVHPSLVERRSGTERRTDAGGHHERRCAQEFRLIIPVELRKGWLAFQCGAETVRIAPIPDGWTALSDADLAALVARAAARAEQIGPRAQHQRAS